MKSICRATAEELARQQKSLLQEHCIHFESLVTRHAITSQYDARIVEYDPRDEGARIFITKHMQGKGYHVKWFFDDAGFIATIRKCQ